METKQKVLDSRYHEKALQEIVKRNKKCADCLKPSPSFVNLSLGSFVCLECSGLLREFDFRIKGLSLSTFTPQEVQMLDLKGGNKRVNQIWLGKHPDGEKATPGWENLEVLRRFLLKKYREKAWYDESVAALPTEAVRSRSDSDSTLSPAPPARKRVGSKDGVIRGALLGQDSHRSFLAATHARAAAQNLSSPDGNTDDESDDSLDSYDEIVDPIEREKKQREAIRTRIAEFYKVHNPEKLDSLDLFVEWVMYHGMSAFNKKLREKYGTDIPNDRKKDLKTKRDKMKAKEERKHREARPLKPELLSQASQLAALEEAAQALALQDLASRSRSNSTNPFDDFLMTSTTPPPSFPSKPMMTSTPQSTFVTAATRSSNPFDELMFL